jgi:hypothetical protein
MMSRDYECLIQNTQINYISTLHARNIHVWRMQKDLPGHRQFFKNSIHRDNCPFLTFFPPKLNLFHEIYNPSRPPNSGKYKRTVS